MSTTTLMYLVLALLSACMVFGLVVLLLAMRGRSDERALSLRTPSAEDEAAAMAYHSDGIVDIYVGLAVLLFGLLMLTDLFWLAGALVATWVPLYRQSKLQYTVPRLSQIRPRPRGRRAWRLALPVKMGISVLIVLSTVAMLWLNRSGRWSVLYDWIQQYGSWAAAVVIAVAWLIGAALHRVWRYFAYAVLSLLAIGLAYLLGIPFALGVATLGLGVLLTGFVILYHFVHRYPA